MSGSGVRLLTTLYLALVMIGCADRTPPPPDADDTGAEPSPPSASCSASTLSASIGVPGGLPPAVVETRTAIAEAAVACDHEALANLAVADGDLVWSFDHDDTPDPDELALAWRGSEEVGDPILATLVQLLELPHATRGGDYVWPSAFTDEPTDADWEAVKAIYREEEIRSFKESGGYAGLRVGISPEGEWQFFVGGD